jgi:hypothetical protein
MNRALLAAECEPAFFLNVSRKLKKEIRQKKKREGVATIYDINIMLMVSKNYCNHIALIYP